MLPLRAAAITCAPLVAAHLCAVVAPFGAAAALLIPFVIVVFPGMLFVPPRSGFGWAYWAMVFGTSAGALMAGLLLSRVAGIRLAPWHGWAFYWVLLTVAWLLRPRALLKLAGRLRPALARWAGWKKLLFISAWLLAFCSSSWVVPPQQDQDMVIANPAYGYLQHGKPYGTETHFAYIFSKPPLLHLQAGAALLLVDRLQQAEFYWQSGRIVQLLDEAPWATTRFRQKDIEAFELNHELVLAARTLTTFYAALVPLLLADLALLLGGAPATALVTGVAYLLIPEVFVRMGYAGFTTPSTAVLALGALLALGPAARWPRFMAGAVLGLLNQKMLFVPAAYGLWRLAPGGVEGIRRVIRDPWLWGVAAGTALWWGYGASVEWSTFLKDHFYYDFRDRFLLQDMNMGTHGPGWYPGVGGLWLEWARNLSPPLLALGVAGVLWGLTQPGSIRFLSLWALAGWLLGSVTDWRQTKHLMLTIVPMVVTAQLLADRYPRWRRIVGLVVLAATAYNGARIVHLWMNFDSLTPSTVW
ncbi:hypothetical protein JXA88_07915 [Candidatus Fermentibacteria bacterium]|nr:hypothetical protein [Candidatus Fermentibacteria bacterium]